MKLSVVSLLIGAATASQGPYRVFEQLSSAPEPWILKDDAARVDQDLSFKLRIHLKNRNVASFQQQVLDISTPDHSSYGRHFSSEEIHSMIAPSDAAFASVLDWLESYNLTSRATVESGWIVIDSTIGEVETLLETKYQVFENTETGKKAARTLAYSLPAGLHAYVDIVAPTIKFSAPKPQLSTIVTDFEAPKNLKAVGTAADIHDGLDVVACNTSTTVDCIQALYKFKHFRGSRRNGNQIGLAGFLEEYAQHDDFEQFLTTYVPDAYDVDFEEFLINGGLNTQDNTGGPQSITEANLDIQHGAGLAYPNVYASVLGSKAGIVYMVDDPTNEWILPRIR